MTIDEIRDALKAAMPLRVPRFDPNTGAREKVEQIEDYMQTAAFHRGELEEALSWLLALGRQLKTEWDGLVGWEAALPRGSNHTNAQVDAAKRTVRPDLWDALEEARGLAKDIGRHVHRLEFDHDAESRVYTLITGG